MFNFRKSLLLVALLASLAAIASAQSVSSVSCVANTARPTVARVEGYAEEVGQVELRCTGGQPVTVGALPRINVQVFLGTEVTSRIVNSSTNGLESWLMLDDPAKGARNYCAAPGNCASDTNNVFQGVLTSTSSITWFGVPFNPPGTAGERKIRIVNVRANAVRVGLGGGFIPNSISMVITISGTNAPSVTNPVQTVAYTAASMKFSSDNDDTFNQCEPGTYPFDVTFTELIGQAFRPKIEYVNGAYLADQSDLGVIYNSESMVSDTNIDSISGFATQGTRLWARFTNIPAGVKIAVSNLNTGYGAGMRAGLVTNLTSSAGDGGTYTTTPGMTTIITDSATNRSGVAVWEVLESMPGVLQDFTFRVEATYDDSPLPSLGAGAVEGNYAPAIDVSTASSTAPVPRFQFAPQDGGSPFEITPCQTNLLFPFVASIGNFDTGIAVSNTSKDPYGTPNQSGTCTFWYYGTGEPTTNPQVTNSAINAGKQVAFSLSTGAPAIGLAGAPGFMGYMIARCHFQYAHGYAFISDVGADQFAQGYLALILDNKTPMPHRRKDGVAKNSENLNN